MASPEKRILRDQPSAGHDCSAKETTEIFDSKTDIYSPPKRSQLMSRIKTAGTTPEVAVRNALTALKLRFRANRKDLPGKPDMVLSKIKIAIFVHGCFWHGHTCPKGVKLPRTNADFWKTKIERTKIRDALKIELLAQRKWRSLVVWECETKNAIELARLLDSLIRR